MLIGVLLKSKIKSKFVLNLFGVFSGYDGMTDFLRMNIKWDVQPLHFLILTLTKEGCAFESIDKKIIFFSSKFLFSNLTKHFILGIIISNVIFSITVYMCYI